MSKKTRTWFDCPVKGQTRPTQFSPFENYSSLGPQSVESRESTNHARWPNGRWENGGAFFLQRNNIVYTPKDYHIHKDFLFGGNQTDGTARLEYPTSSVHNLTPYSHPDNAQLWEDGATAISRVEPTNPSTQLSVAIGEFRAEGLPNLPGEALREKTRLAKASGSEYLSVQFGWLPLVSSVKQFASVVDRSDVLLRNFQESANIVLKRRYDFPVKQDAWSEPMRFSMTPSIGFFDGGGYTQRISQRKWFEAEFQFYLPTGGSITDKMRRYGAYARKLYGLEITPEVLWNLAPWSWAADWFGNMGDILHNVSALGHNGLVMRHAYIMCHTQQVLISSGRFEDRGEMVKVETNETKTRLPATPYGFGVSYDGLSVTQKAVIAALGLSRW